MHKYLPEVLLLADEFNSLDKKLLMDHDITKVFKKVSLTLSYYIKLHFNFVTL